MDIVAIIADVAYIWVNQTYLMFKSGQNRNLLNLRHSKHESDTANLFAASANVCTYESDRK